MTSGARAPETTRMDRVVPFCEECGRPGVRLTGFHPTDAGLVRWTQYCCGHMKTQIVLEDELESVDGLAVSPRQ